LTPATAQGQGDMAAKPGRGNIRLRVVAACLLFSVGFSLVFVLMGAGAGTAGKWLISYRPILGRVSGGIILLLGLFILGLVKLKPLYAERRFRPPRLGAFTAPLAGMAFAFGWTPCVGPFLGSLLALAAASGTASRGAFYLAVYSAGLALPFLLSALLLTSLLGAFGWLKRHFPIINAIAGALLVAVGALLLVGKFDLLTNALYYGLKVPDPSLKAFRGASVGVMTSFAAGVFSFLSPCVLPLVPGYLSFISGVAVEDLIGSEGK